MVLPLRFLLAFAHENSSFRVWLPAIAIIFFGETCQLRWTIPGSRTYYGVGLKVGDTLHAGWSTGSNTYAVISYTFIGRVAQVTWSIGGSNRTAKENLARK